MNSESLEIEVKLRTEDGVKLLRESSLALEEEKPRHFEENWLLDMADGQLTAKSEALRIRVVGDEAWLTYKGPAGNHSQFKEREEIETTAGDGHKLLAIFERLGFRRRFIYQKWRTVYRVKLPDGSSLQAMVDETPLGQFLELEGERPAISEAAAALGFKPEQYITASYPALQAEACRLEGKKLRDMLF